MPKTKPTGPPDTVRQAELREVLHLQMLVQVSALELRQRIERGAQIEQGVLSAHITGDFSAVEEVIGVDEAGIRVEVTHA